MKIGYARVSTADQNLDLQISALKNAGCERVYKEKKSSVAERPELDKMLKYLRPGDQVVVWKIDRLARSLKHLILLIEDFKKKKIEFMCLTNNIDTTTPMGLCFLSIVGAFAELERNLIIERTKAGLAAAREKGVKLGRRPGLTENQQVIKKAACDLYRKGMTTNDICKSLKVSTATLYRYLRAGNMAMRGNPGRPKGQSLDIDAELKTVS